jgi:Domain of unknown function (DUF1707)/FHA domain
MAGSSSADTPATPEFLRASDAERDQAVAELRNEFAQGRLSHDTFLVRMQTAMDARHRGELARLFTDLPPRRNRLPERIKTAWRRLVRGQSGDATPEGAGRPTAAIRALPGHQQVPRPYQPGPLPPPPWAHAPVSQPPVALFFPPGSGARFTIGRTHDCDLRLTDLSVSRLHAELTRGEDGWLLADLGSHNGTRLNGWLVREPVPVRAGDRVEFGSAAFIMRDRSAIES